MSDPGTFFVPRPWTRGFAFGLVLLLGVPGGILWANGASAAPPAPTGRPGPAPAAISNAVLLPSAGLTLSAGAKPVLGFAPLAVSFTFNSATPSAPPFGFNWSFGDKSANGTVGNVTHVYGARGTYNATLHVVDSTGRSGNWSTQIVVLSDPLGVWRSVNVSTVPAPTPRQAAAMAYDPQLGAVVLFGGQDTYTGQLGDTWEFVNNRWVDITSTLTTSPSARWGVDITYDPQVKGVLLWGGRAGYAGGFRNDTWLFNRTGWHNITKPHAPPAQAGGDFTYDAADGYVFLRAGGGYWSFANGTWTDITSSVTGGPPLNTGYDAAYDATDHYIVYFGGDSSCFNGPGDTWTYRGGNWTNRTATAGTPPPAGDGSRAMTYDPWEEGVVIVGGYTGSCNVVNTTYVFRGGTWTNLTNYSHPVPPGRWDGGLAFDPKIGGDLMSEGNENLIGGSNSFYNDTWIYFDGLLPQIRSRPAHCDVPCTLNLTAVVPNGGAGGMTYLWNFSDGGPNASGSAVTHTFPGHGNYSVALFVNDSSGRFGSVASGVNVSYPPQAHPYTSVSSGEAPILVGFTANATNGTPLLSYAWQFGDSATSTQSNPSHTYLAHGVYEWNLTVTDAAGVSIVRHGNLSIYPGFVVSATDSRRGGAVPLTVYFNASAAGGDGPYTYAWSFGDGTNGPNSNSTSHTYARVGTFTAWLNATDQLRILRQVRFTVVIVPALLPGAQQSVGIGEVPLNVSFQAQPTGGQSPYRFLWTFGVGTANSSFPAPSFTYTNVGTFHPKVAVTDAFGDVSVQQFNVTTVAVLASTVSGAPLQGILPAFHVAFTAGSSGGVPPITYAFDFGDGHSGTGSSATHTYTIAGQYKVIVTATDKLGDFATSQLTVQVALAPQVGLSANVTEIAQGGSVAFSARAAGGYAPYTFAWTGLPSNCTAANVSAFDCTPGTPGSYNVTVTLTDSDHNTANASLALVVLARSAPTHPSGTTSGGLPVLTLAIIGAVVAAAALGAGILLLRRRGGPPPFPPTGPTEPSVDRFSTTPPAFEEPPAGPP